MTYIIDHNIPVPVTHKRTKFDSMIEVADSLEPGQSFLIKEFKISQIQHQAGKLGKIRGKTFVVRNVDGAVRLWRVA